jgi:hypothetical protein
MLSYRFKPAGYFLVGTGIIFTILYFTVKFRFEIPVFAVASTYLKTKYLTTFSTNFSDESIFILLLAGLSLIVFSKEKDERESFAGLRHKALIRAIIADILFLIFTVVFIYGAGFIAAVLINVFLPFFLYIIIFNIMKFQELRNG